MKNKLFFWFSLSFLVVGLLMNLGSCGTISASGGTRAERIFVNQTGYACFIVYDSHDTAVGGNCLKE